MGDLLKSVLDAGKSFVKKNPVAFGLLLLIIVVGFYSNYHNVSQLKQLPSCIYGCDLYYHNGGIINVIEGKSYLDNPQMNGEYSWTPPLYNWLVSGFAKLFGLDSIHAVLYFSYVLQLAAILLIFYITYKITSNAFVSLIPAALINYYFPVLKYTNFATVLITPLFFYSLYLFFIRQDLKRSVLLGIMLGIVAISHTNYFIGAVMITALTFVYMIYTDLLPLKWHQIKQKIIDDKLRYFVVVFATGGLISLLTWWVPIFVYGLKLPNDITSYNYYDLSKFSNAIFATFELFKVHFLNFHFTSLMAVMFSLICASIIAGYIILVFDKNRTPAKTFFIILVPIVLIATNHHLISEPVIGTSFFPTRIAESADVFIYGVLFAFIVNLLMQALFKRHKVMTLFAINLIMMLLLLGVYLSSLTFFDGTFNSSARNELDPFHAEVMKWVDENTQIDDVFLTTNENSFMLSGLTGRKGVNFRRAHSGSYVDVDQRYIDAAIMLYGNDSAKTSELLRKYDVKYVYWDYFWVESEFTIDNGGNVQGWYDPLILMYTPQKENVLRSYNISYMKQTTWLDPSERSPRTRMYDSLIIDWRNYRSAQVPWNDNLGAHLVPVKQFVLDGYTYGVIYEVVR